MPNWTDLHALLLNHVPFGRVTTYGAVSAHFYENVRNRNQPVRAMLVGEAAHGNPDLSHRVVKDDGSLAEERPRGGRANQHNLLAAENVTFDHLGRVNACHIVDPLP